MCLLLVCTTPLNTAALVKSNPDWRPSLSRVIFQLGSPTHSLPCPSQMMHLEQRSPPAAARRGARVKTWRARQHRCTDVSPCPVPAHRRSGQIRLARSQACRLCPPRTRGHRSYSPCLLRSGLRTFALPGSCDEMALTPVRVGGLDESHRLKATQRCGRLPCRFGDERTAVCSL